MTAPTANQVRVPVDATGRLLAVIDAMTPITTATLSNVTSAAADTLLVAANAARKGLIIYNDSTSTLSIKFGSASSGTSFTVRLLSNTSYEMNPLAVYTGQINGIWSAANGAARITELT